MTQRAATRADRPTDALPADAAARVPAAWPGEAARLIALAAELHEALGAAATTTPFERLLIGATNPHDATLLTRPVAGSRLLVAQLDGPSAEGVLSTLPVAVGVHVQARSPDQIVALVPEYPRTCQAEPAELLAQQVLRRCARARVGISSVLRGEADLPIALRDCLAAADVAAPRTRPVVRADHSWAEVTVARVRQSLTQCVTLDSPLRRLHEHDRDKNTRLVESLRTWLDHNGDVTTAAAALHLHPNSLRYRIRRAQEVSGLRLDDPRARALAHLFLVP